MTRLVPIPLLSLLLWLVWVLLNGFNWGHALLGLGLALLLPLITRPFWPNVPRLRSLPRLLCFLALVCWDIVVANLIVARLILRSPRRLRPTFVELPLDLSDDFAITMLMSTVSLTPGTVSADISEDRSVLLIHAMDVEDVDAMVAEIKQRYERRLKEMFEC